MKSLIKFPHSLVTNLNCKKILKFEASWNFVEFNGPSTSFFGNNNVQCLQRQSFSRNLTSRDSSVISASVSGNKATRNHVEKYGNKKDSGSYATQGEQTKQPNAKQPNKLKKENSATRSGERSPKGANDENEANFDITDRLSKVLAAAGSKSSSPALFSHRKIFF